MAEGPNELSRLFDHLSARWEANQAGKLRLAGWRDSLWDMGEWLKYCAAYKPVSYREWLAVCLRYQNGEIPSPYVAGSHVEAIAALTPADGTPEYLRLREQWLDAAARYDAQAQSKVANG